MRTLSNDTGQIKLRELIETARSEPVTVLEKGEPVAVVRRIQSVGRARPHPSRGQGASAPDRFVDPVGSGGARPDRGRARAAHGR